jgi:hypothetical protein
MKKQRHCLKEIHTDLSLLNAIDMRHIENCPRCRTEYEIYQRLERAIATLPEAAMPEELQKQILSQLLQPGYSLRHLIAALGIACLSPVLISLMSLDAFLAPGMLAGIYGGSGILIVLLLSPIVHFLISRHRLDIESLVDRIDHLFEKWA